MKTVRFQIHLLHFTFEDLVETDQEKLQETTQIALVFNKGQVPHPTNSTWTVDLKGYFLLSLPYGAYPDIPEYETERFDNLIREWMLASNLVDSNSDINSYPTKDVFAIAPALKLWNKKTEIAMKCLFWWRVVDKFLADSMVTSPDSTPVLLKEHFTDLARFFTNITTGMYRNTDGIPNFDILFLNHAMRAFFQLYVDLKENVAGYEANHRFLLTELLNWIQSYKLRALYMVSTWDQLQQANFTFKKICGKRIIIELLQLLTATYVNQAMRDNLLFKMFCNSGDLIQIMAADVFCLPKDGIQDNSSNMILRNIKKRGMSFDEALELHMTSVNNEMIDFKRHAESLAAEFPDSDHMQKYIHNYQCYVDGWIRAFPTQIRYGTCDFKIMKVLTQENII